MESTRSITDRPKPRRIRQHLNPLSAQSMVVREPLGLPPEEGQYRNASLWVELGCAEAQFIRELSVQYPDDLFVGLDIRRIFLKEGQQAVVEKNLENVRLEVCNLLVDTPHLFRKETVRVFLINFPDPFFKTQQRKRRWLSESVLQHLIDALEPNGEIFFQSDIWEPALHALALLESNTSIQNVAGSWSFLKQSPFLARSTREAACVDENKKIWRLLFRKKNSPTENSAGL